MINIGLDTRNNSDFMYCYFERKLTAAYVYLMLSLVTNLVLITIIFMKLD